MFLIKLLIKSLVNVFFFIATIIISCLLWLNLGDKRSSFKFLRYALVNAFYFQRFLRFPNLKNPDSLNEYINSRKFIDISDVIEVSDKIKVKNLADKI